MSRKRFDAMACSIARTLDLVGDWWTLLIVREAFLGVRHFAGFLDHLGIARNILADRLQKLVANGILSAEPKSVPGRGYEYRLTEKGFDLYPLLIAIRDWGDKYLVGEEGSPLSITHRDCGAVVHTEVHCESGHTLDSPRDAVPRPGPGARLRRPAALSNV